MAWLAGLGLIAGPAAAQFNLWANPGAGDWFVPGNWSYGVPQAGSAVAFDNGGLALISSAGAQAAWLLFGSGPSRGHLDVFGAGTLTIDSWLDVNRGTMQILSGGRVWVLDSARPNVYSRTELGLIGSSALVVDGPGSYLRSTNLVAGRPDAAATGTITVANGARVDSASVRLNLSTATVSGGNALWAVDRATELDLNSTLTVSDQGQVSTDMISAAFGSTILVTGAGSRLVQRPGTGALVIGASGLGTLSLLDGGTVLSQTATLGWDGGADNPRGTASVSGTGSSWVNAGLLVVGGGDAARPVGKGTGSVNISSGAVLRNGTAHLGSHGGSSGSVNVAGANSRWDNSGDLVVGVYGTGTADISSGAVLRNGTANLGSHGGAYGKVSVAGANSRWDNSGDLVVGNQGIGIVDIRGGAALTSVRGHVGFQSGANGSVTLSDAGSSWMATGSMFIGNGGSGTLNILNGAVAGTSGNAYLGIAAGSQGQAMVSGAGSRWNITAAGTNLNIGGNQTQAGGSGALSIESGAAVTAQDTHLYNTGTLALLDGGTLNGPVSSWGGLIRTRGVNTLAGAITLQAGGVFIQPVDAASTLTLSGNIGGPGGLTKSSFLGSVGRGTLVLSGSNSYAGPTTVDIGTLLVNGTQASAVFVNAGTLGGTGAIGAAVTVGDSVGSADATLAPGAGVGTLATGDLVLRADGLFAFELDSAAALADQVVITGSVTLDPGAAFSFADLAAGVLAPGLSFVAIDNDGDDAIAGQFAGLAEGAEISSGANRYVVSYIGGTGNDLMLTSVPEPASGALLLAGLVGLGAMARQRVRRKPAAQAAHRTTPRSPA